MTLNEREAFWTEQLPIFKENYICLAQLEAVEFNKETGNFDALTVDATGFDLDDIMEAYHSVNTGWAMWLRAKSQEKAKAQAVPVSHTHSVTLTCAELKEAYDFGAPDESHEQLTDLVTIGWHENGHSGAGYYAYMSECEDEGSIKLGESESGAEG